MVDREKVSILSASTKAEQPHGHPQVFVSPEVSILSASTKAEQPPITIPRPMQRRFQSSPPRRRRSNPGPLRPPAAESMFQSSPPRRRRSNRKPINDRSGKLVSILSASTKAEQPPVKATMHILRCFNPLRLDEGGATMRCCRLLCRSCCFNPLRLDEGGATAGRQLRTVGQAVSILSASTKAEQPSGRQRHRAQR